jgi:hypothetical protein
MKLHALGSASGPEAPSGVYAYHNTFVRPYHAIQLSTPDVVRYYAVMNNLFVAPAQPTANRVVAWDTPIDYATGTIDYNGYFPDGEFELGYGATGATYASFAAMQAGGRYEKHGVLLGSATFASGLTAPSDHHPKVSPMAAALASGAAAIDKGNVLANVNDGYRGAAPDLGALEVGCPAPTYGPRADGVDEANEIAGCASRGGDGDGGASSDGGADAGVVGANDGGASADGGGANGGAPGNASDSGCGCREATRTSASGAGLAALGTALALFVARSRARRRRR